MNDTARVLLTAAVLSAVALTTYAWRLTRTDPESAERLIGELRLAQWAAVFLAGSGAIAIGLALAGRGVPASNLDAMFGVLFVGLAGIVLQRDPREALLLAAGAFVLHALVTLAHRPGWLPPELAPRWFMAASATYDVYLAAVCYWARRR